MSETASLVGVPIYARLKIPAAPVPTRPAYLGAVWNHDYIIPVRRIGNRWLCKVWYGHDGLSRMEALIPKKWLRLEFAWITREAITP